jgi:glutaredoxin 3
MRRGAHSSRVSAPAAPLALAERISGPTMAATTVARKFPGALPQEKRVARIEMYTTAICPYCVAAKSVLKAKGLEYSEIRVDTDAAKRDEMLARSGGRRTVPQIFINDQHVGGHDDLVAADRSGRLAELLGSNA